MACSACDFLPGPDLFLSCLLLFRIATTIRINDCRVGRRFHLVWNKISSKGWWAIHPHRKIKKIRFLSCSLVPSTTYTYCRSFNIPSVWRAIFSRFTLSPPRDLRRASAFSSHDSGRGAAQRYFLLTMPAKNLQSSPWIVKYWGRIQDSERMQCSFHFRRRCYTRLYWGLRPDEDSWKSNNVKIAASNFVLLFSCTVHIDPPGLSMNNRDFFAKKSPRENRSHRPESLYRTS